MSVFLYEPIPSSKINPVINDMIAAKRAQANNRKGLPNVSNLDSDLARHRISLPDNRDRCREKKSPSLSNLTHQEGTSKYKVSKFPSTLHFNSSGSFLFTFPRIKRQVKLNSTSSFGTLRFVWPFGSLPNFLFKRPNVFQRPRNTQIVRIFLFLLDVNSRKRFGKVVPRSESRKASCTSKT